MHIIEQGVFQAPNPSPNPTLRRNSCYLILKISTSEWTPTETRFIIDSIKENKIKGGKKKQIKNVERKESDHNKDGQVASLYPNPSPNPNPNSIGNESL